MDNDEVKSFIWSRFTEEEWQTLMDCIHTNSNECNDKERELKRRYWRLKKAESRMRKRYERMADPEFILWLRNRGLPTNKYKHSYWRDYMIDKGGTDGGL